MKSSTDPTDSTTSLARFWTFIWVGGVNTLIGYSVFVLALKFASLQYNIALFVAYVVGITIGYFNHRRVTFQSKAKHPKAFAKFVLTYAGVYGVNALLLTALIELAHIAPLVGQLISLVIVTLLSFVMQRYWVFRHD